MRRRRLPGEKEASTAWWLATINKRPVLLAAGEDEARAVDVKAHHVVTQQRLRALARDLGLGHLAENALLWDVRNGVPVSSRRHDRHHSYHERITGAELANLYPEVLEFVADNRLEPWFERFYPTKEAP